MKSGSLIVGVALGATLAGALLRAGPLNPPAGPVTGTYKTLAEVEPRIAVNAANTPGDADSLYKITQPGSYYLTGSITGVAGKHGIEIAASGVTLDLMGFDLNGIAGMGPFDGVSATAGLSGIHVRNGSIQSWGRDGAQLWSPSSAASDLRAGGNGRMGIYVRDGCEVTGCSATNNATEGIVVGGNSVVTRCTAVGNTGMGISAGFGAAITDCAARANGSTGILADYGSAVRGCVSSDNSGGISINSGSTISGCSASGNTNAGIGANAGCTITGCTVYGNTGNGVQTGIGCTISGCTARANTGGGVSAAELSNVAGCAVNENGAAGITVGNSSTVTRCDVSQNGLSGIVVLADSVVEGNLCNGNGTAIVDGAGVRLTSANNRVERNNCSNNDRAIEALVNGNLIIGNSASSNAVNFIFAANNRYGPIVDITSLTAPVSGNSAPSTLTTTDPHANFRY